MDTGKLHIAYAPCGERPRRQGLDLGPVHLLRQDGVDVVHHGQQPLHLSRRPQLRPTERGDPGARNESAQAGRHRIGLAVAEHDQARRVARRSGALIFDDLRQGQPLQRVHVAGIELQHATPDRRGGLEVPCLLAGAGRSPQVWSVASHVLARVVQLGAGEPLRGRLGK